MLSALRRFAGTWIATVLFVLLIFSFAIWGIGDMVGNFGRDTALARVGGEAITVEEAQTGLRRELQRLTRTLGPQFEADARVRRALAQQATDALVMDRVLRQEAERLHLAVPDEAVRDFVFQLEGFRGLDGRFSRAAFDAFLRGSGLTEAEFLNAVRADLARQQVTVAVRAGSAAPDALAKPLLRWLLEQRSAVLVTLRTADAAEPPAPAEAALRRYMENNPERFSTPEFRDATVAVMSADRLMQEVEIADAELQAAYDARRDRFEAPERRALEQVLVQDEAKAGEIAEAWRRGADAREVAAQAAAAGGELLELGAVARADLPVPALAEAAFALPAGGVTAPVQTPLGWHVLRVARVARVEPPQSRSLAEVRDELRAELAAEKAADVAFERANRVEDALAGGATLEEAARRYNLGLARVRADAQGDDAEGRPVPLPVIEASREPLMRAVFAAQPGAAPRLRETEAGFVAVVVHEVVPPALRPFEAVEAQVREAVLADARRREQEQRAAALLVAVRGGKPLAEAAAEAGLGSREVGAIGRDPEAAGPIPRELVAPLFELKRGEATMVPTRDGFVVAQVTEVTTPDPDADAAVLARVRGQLAQAVAQDLEVQFLSALRGRADVRVNPRLLDQLAQP